MIRDKAKGKEVVLHEAPEPSRVADLMEALRQSIEATKKGQRPREAKGPETNGQERSRDGGRGGSSSRKKATGATTTARRKASQKGRKLKKAS